MNDDGLRVPDSGKPPASLGRYGFGLLVSAALTLLLLWLGIYVIAHPDMGYGGIVIILAAVFIGGPLAVVLLITWGVYMARSRGNVPGRVHLLMFVPSLLSLFVVPIADDIRQSEADRFDAAHPVMREIHVNLSGKPLWLAPDVLQSAGSTTSVEMPMKPAPWASFVSFSRYPDSTSLSSGAFPYDGIRLRKEVTTYTYGTGSTDGQGQTGARSVPLIRMPDPDVDAIKPYQNDSALLIYQYFHYADRVEVAASLTPSVGTDEARDKLPRLVTFYLSSHVPPAIARLEVDGQTLLLGDSGPIEIDAQCKYDAASIGYALVDLGRALKLRWQTIDNPWQWHEASLTLPPLPAGPVGARPVSFPGVQLYFPGGGRVMAKRFQSVMPANGDRIMLTTGRPADLPADQVCPRAEDGDAHDGATVPQ